MHPYLLNFLFHFYYFSFIFYHIILSIFITFFLLFYFSTSSFSFIHLKMECKFTIKTGGKEEESVHL